MTNPPDEPAKPPRKRKDPARPTRAKAAREALPPIAPALADLLNPAINRGEAGVGSQTGLKPPPDNSRDRRADFAAAHKARASTPEGFSERPQSGYVARSPLRPGPGEIDPDLARALGLTDDDAGAPPDEASSSQGPGQGALALPRAGEVGTGRNRSVDLTAEALGRCERRQHGRCSTL